MRIAFISDVHANAPALQAVLGDIDEKGIEIVYCAGDVIGYNAFPNESVQLLKDSDVTSIRGNHDEAVLTETPEEFNISAKRAVDWTRRNLSSDSQEYLEGLNYESRITKNSIDIYMTHGSPEDKLHQYIHEEMVTERRIKNWFDKIPDVIVLGHTHQQFIAETDLAIVLNPGSVGQPRDRDPRASYAILDTETRTLTSQRIEYNIDKTAEQTQAVLPRKLADRLYEGR